MKFAKENRALLKINTIKANLEEIFIELTNSEDENSHQQNEISEVEEVSVESEEEKVL